jgi:hypothetical protein
MPRTCITFCVLISALALAACSGASLDLNNNWNNGAPGLGKLQINPEPAGADEDFGFSDTDEKVASAAYQYFFHDAVNHHSGSRWSVENLTGKKAWILSNTYYTEPKAWLLGGNYWNNESDILTSNPGTVPAGRRGIKVGFHSRWRIAEGDECSVEVSVDGGEWGQLAVFTGGQNPSFPGWDRYTLALPDCGPQDQQYQVRFVFSSNASVVDAGFGVDRFAIYQTLLTPPADIAPSNEEPNQLTVYLTHNFDGERPGAYEVYRSDDGEFGEYVSIGTTPYPGEMFGTSWVDPTAQPQIEYWYMIKSIKDGWEDSAFSEADWGTYIFE